MYESFVMVFGTERRNTKHETKHDAVREALRQDIYHSFGDDGISCVRDLETGSRVLVCNSETHNILGCAFSEDDITDNVVRKVTELLVFR
jgi:hypothetical protein